VADTREGWVDALRVLINSYIRGTEAVAFDYSFVRKRGTPLKKFGGTASGPDPLAEGLATIRYLLEQNTKITSLLICDICNVVATIVIAGNVRRSSEIFISSNPEMMKYKDWNKYPYRSQWSWASNNSYKFGDGGIATNLDIQHQIHLNGEPGIFNIDNCRKYGRTGELVDDARVLGCNPCGEISLEGLSDTATGEKYSAGGETCNICETYPSNYEGDLATVVAEFGRDLYYAVLYCKTVTLLEPHWKSTAEIQNRNRRIGVSQTGIQQFIHKHGLSLSDYGAICDEWYGLVKKYDAEISKLLAIPTSIKLTTVKPSGTVSICGGVSSGMHCPIANYYIRRVRYNSELTACTKLFQKKGFHVEPDIWQQNTTSIVSFPIKYEGKTRTDITMQEQFDLALTLQRHWSDNQVSCTVTYRPEELSHIAELLDKYRSELKGISFLALDCTAYQQAPEEIITRERYDEMMVGVADITFEDFENFAKLDVEDDNYCDGDSCKI
jgi:adenosylcobalamin-dependent ribonucleoside-triphosphate reductase